MRIPLGDEDDADSLRAKFGPVLPVLLRQALERVARGDPGEPQVEDEASYAGLFEVEWRTIDWTCSARTIHNQVRSWTGLLNTPKGALGEVNGALLQITRTQLLPSGATGEAPAPGTVLRRDEDAMVVQCGDGPIALVAWSNAGTASG